MEDESYPILIPESVREIIARLNEIDILLMRHLIASRAMSVEQLEETLDSTTTMYSYFLNLAGDETGAANRLAVQKYIEIKRATPANVKFVDASTDREAEYEVRDIRYRQTIYEVQAKRCEQYINTCKKRLDSLRREVNTSR